MSSAEKWWKLSGDKRTKYLNIVFQINMDDMYSQQDELTLIYRTWEQHNLMQSGSQKESRTIQNNSVKNQGDWRGNKNNLKPGR